MAPSLKVASAGLLAIASSPALAEDWQCDRSPLVVTNARLWNDGKALSNREIVIANGRVSAAGRAGSLRRPEGGRVIDARGAWLLPGLIDSHVHFGRASLLSADLLPKPYPPSWSVTGPQTLASGVTTVKIHYADLERGPALAKASNDDCSAAPTVILGASGLLGGKPEEGSWLPQVSSAEDARQKVRANAAVGAKWIALHDTEKFAPDQLSAIVDEAHKSGMRVMGSGDSVAEAQAGIDAGADAIDQWDGSPSAQLPASQVASLKRHGTFLVAPIGFYTRYNAYRSDPKLIDRDAWVARRFDTAVVGEAMVNGTRDRFGRPPASEQQLVDNFPMRRAKFKQLLDGGAKLVVGSDSGSQGNFHGDAIWWELRAWRDNGAPISKLLAAATTVPAAMLDMVEIGSLKTGSRGDFLIYRGDLAKGELEVSKVMTVAKAGVIFLKDGRWVGPPTPADAKP